MQEQPKPYTVKYRTKGRLFFRRIWRVTGDYRLDKNTLDSAGNPAPWPFAVRVFETKRGVRIEVPMDGTEFRFSPQRLRNLQLKLNEDANQKVF